LNAAVVPTVKRFRCLSAQGVGLEDTHLDLANAQTSPPAISNKVINYVPDMALNHAIWPVSPPIWRITTPRRRRVVHVPCEATAAEHLVAILAGVAGHGSGVGTQVRGRYNGCAGCPPFVIRSIEGLPPLRRMMSSTCAPLFNSDPCAPHAQITAALPPIVSAMAASLSGPTGSTVAALNSFGFVARKANKFTTTIPEYPQSRANPMHRRIVGSSTSASAVLGLSMTKHTRSPGAHCRSSQ